MGAKTGRSLWFLELSSENDLKYLGEAGKPFIDREVLEDLGVLAFSMNPAQGWRQGCLVFQNLKDIGLRADHIKKVRFQAKVNNELYQKVSWSNFFVVLHNEQGLWVELTGGNLRKVMKPDRWARLSFDVKEIQDKAKIDDPIHQISIGFNSQYEVGGRIYMADFELVG